MLKVITDEISKGYERKKWETELLKKDKYALLKTFYCGWQLQVYLYAFMYIDPDTIPLEDYFPV